MAASMLSAAATLDLEEVVLPSDITVTLTAEPSTRLAPLQTIHFTLTATNHGPEPVPRLALTSSPIYDQFTLYDGTSDCGLITSVADGPTDFWYYRAWYVASEAFGSPPLAVGESRVCHFTESLTSSAPVVTSYSFLLPETWSDPDPSNNVGTVYLHRASVATSIPTLSSAMAGVLAGALIGIAWIERWRRKRWESRGAPSARGAREAPLRSRPRQRC